MTRAIPNSPVANYTGTQALSKFDTIFTALGLGANLGQFVKTEYSAVATGVATMSIADAVPTVAQGDQYMTQAVTPLNAGSTLEVTVVWNGANNGPFNQVVALFQDGVCIAAAYAVPQAANQVLNITFKKTVATGAVTPTTFTVRSGATAASTTTFNGNNAARVFGGVMASGIYVKEILPSFA